MNYESMKYLDGDVSEFGITIVHYFTPSPVTRRGRVGVGK